MIDPAPRIAAEPPSHEGLSPHQEAEQELANLAGPERRCLATGEVRAKSELLRFVVAPDGQLVADLRGRLPGRGLWISATPEAFAKARAKRCFARAARQQVEVPDDLEFSVYKGLQQAVLEQLGLLRRSGHLDLGFEKAKAALLSGRARWAFSSQDASSSSLSKFLPGAQARAEMGLDHRVLPFPSSVLGAQLGRAQTNFLALRHPANPRRLNDLLDLLHSLQPLAKPARPMTDLAEPASEAATQSLSVSPRP